MRKKFSKTSIIRNLKEASKTNEEESPLTIKDVEADLAKAAITEFGSWEEAKTAAGLKKTFASDEEVIENLVKAYENRQNDKKTWRRCCKYAIDRFGSMDNAYRKAKIKREHRNETEFIRNFKKAYKEKHETDETYQEWRKYCQKAFNKYGDLKTAYEKANIKEKL